MKSATKELERMNVEVSWLLLNVLCSMHVYGYTK